jgi:hypothetical protein
MALVDDFRDAALSGHRQEIIGVQWKVTNAIADWLLIGDMRTSHVTLLADIAAYQSGFVRLDEITEAAGIGVRHRKTARFTILNKEYLGAVSSTPRRVQEIARGNALLGSEVEIYMWINDGDKRSQTDEWIQVTLFKGVVAATEFGHHTHTITCVQTTSGSVACPDLFHDGSLVCSSDSGTPVEIEETKNQAIPFCIGRMDATALRDWPATHPFSYEHDGSGLNGDHQEFYAGYPALFPAMLGVKHPMLPVVVTHEKVDIENDAGTPETARGFVAAYGAEGTWDLGCNVSGLGVGSTDKEMEHRIPSLADYDDGRTATLETWGMIWTSAFTWQKGKDLSVGTPFNRDMHAFNVGTNGQQLLGAGWHEYTTPTNAPHGLFFPSGASDDAGTDEPKRSGVVQSIALPLEKIGTLGGELAEHDDPLDGGTKTVSMVNTVTDAENLIDSDPLTYCDINSGEQAVLQLRPEADALGQIVQVRIMALLDFANSDTDLFIGFRQSPAYGGTDNMRWEWNGSNGGTWDSYMHGTAGSNLYVKCPLSTTDHSFVSVNLTPIMFEDDTISVVEQPTDGSAWGVPGFSREWEFMCWGRSAPTGSPTPPTLKWSPEVVLWAEDTAKKVRVYNVWIEPVYKSRFASTIKKFEDTESEPWTRFVRNTQDDHLPLMFRNRGHFAPVPATSSNVPTRVETSGRSPLFLCGRGVRDDDSGTITGTARAIIERPDHVLDVLLRHFGNPSKVTASSTFGSFTDAGSAVGDIDKLALVVTEAGKLSDVVDTVASQARSFAYEGIDLNGTRKWWMFTDADTFTASRLYWTDGFFFKWGRDGGTSGHLAAKNGIRPDSFRISTTDVDDLVTRFTLNYGYHDPTGAFAYKHYVTPDETSLTSDATTYKSLCEDAEDTVANGGYAVSISESFEAPDLWDHDAAEAYLKWLVNQRVNHRVAVEFTTYALALELRPGHIIRFDDEIGDVHPYPGKVSGDNWSSHEFLVAETIVNEAGPFVTVTVRCVEHHDSP